MENESRRAEVSGQSRMISDRNGRRLGVQLRSWSRAEPRSRFFQPSWSRAELSGAGPRASGTRPVRGPGTQDSERPFPKFAKPCMWAAAAQTQTLAWGVAAPQTFPPYSRRAPPLSWVSGGPAGAFMNEARGGSGGFGGLHPQEAGVCAGTATALIARADKIDA